MKGKKLPHANSKRKKKGASGNEPNGVKENPDETIEESETARFQRARLRALKIVLSSQEEALELTNSRLRRWKELQKVMDQLEDLITKPQKIETLNHLDQINLWKIFNYLMQRDLTLHQLVLANTKLLDNQKRYFQELSFLESELMMKKLGPSPFAKENRAKVLELYGRMVMANKAKQDKHTETGDEDGGSDMD